MALEYFPNNFDWILAELFMGAGSICIGAEDN